MAAARILIIDDDAKLTSLLRDYLEADEFSAVVAQEPVAGVDAALSSAYALAG
jgi:DNA-binding response OmpR family regulator